jgi:hypothetical protein
LVPTPQADILPVQGDDYEAGRTVMERRKSVYFSFACTTRKERILTLTLSKGILKLLMCKIVLQAPFGMKGVSYNKK